jgi:hypothetical protein
MAPFDSLTLALEAWFDRPLVDLPEGLRLRAEAELMPLRWEDLSPDQRRSVALQLDYQHDPATAQDQRFWWDHFQRQDDLKAQIAQWEDAAAPTAAEVALRETRLKELRQELARMEGLARRAGSDYFPKRDSECETSREHQRSAVRYVAYPKAMAQLKERLNATPEELAAWIWFGPEEGGIAAYVNANELDPPPRFQFELGTGNGEDHDYVSPLMACWFLEDEIAEFNPADRYITGEALIKRWAERPGLKAEAWVRAKIQESRLSDLHPLCGGTQGTSPEDASLPPMTTGLFRMSDVEAIEAEDFDNEHAQNGAAAGSIPANRGAAVSLGSANAAASDSVGATHSVSNAAIDVAPNATNEKFVGVGRGSTLPGEPNQTAAAPTATAEPEVGSPEWRKKNAQVAANAKHDRPGGSRDKKRRIREAWASGKYSTRGICAEQECAGLNMSYVTAVKALRNTPEPTKN